jgi:YidC/Oxa1 family membrane protein insertase
MGITMFIQQKLSPSTLDPMQAKIMLFLPIIFTIMFMGFPSGLVIYWIANNVFTIIQQLIDTRLIKSRTKAK